MPRPTPPYPPVPRSEEFADPVIKVYEQVTDELLVNIARRFSVTDTTAGTPEWQFRKLAEMGKLTKENIAIIAKLTGQNPELLQEAITQAALISLEQIEPRLQEAARAGLLSTPPSTPLISPRITALLQEYQMQAVDKLNLVNTVMLNSSLEAYRLGITTTAFNYNQMIAAQGILNQETGAVILGAKSQQQAVRNAIQRMTSVGLTGFVDRAGRSWTPEAYVSMDMRTTMHNTYVQSAFRRNQDYGNDLVYPGIKATSRELCYPWQGKILSTSNRSGTVQDLDGNIHTITPISNTSYGEPAGIWGINCGHSCNVFIPGATIIRGEVPPKEENDKRYALSQEQRRLEREVRYAKRDAQIAKETNDKEAFDKAALRVKGSQTKLNDFLSENDLNPSLARTQVVGYNRSVASSVTQSAKRQERFQQFVKDFRISSPTKKQSAEAIEYIRSIREKGASLSINDQRILEQIKKRFAWVQVKPAEANIYTLAALTAKTGDEFAMFAKGDLKYIIHGASSREWGIPKDLARIIFDNQLNWTGHSHPTTVNLTASVEDVTSLREFFPWQTKSSVIDMLGNIVPFNSTGF